MKLKICASKKYKTDWKLIRDSAEGWDIRRIQAILLQEIRDELTKLNTALMKPKRRPVRERKKAAR